MKLTNEDARTLAGILASADGYCETCARDLAKEMQEVAPDHDWPTLVKEAADRYWGEGDSQ